jgi:hypothetical protein
MQMGDGSRHGGENKQAKFQTHEKLNSCEIDKVETLGRGPPEEIRDSQPSTA